MCIKGGMDGDAASLFWLMEIRKSAVIRTGKGRFAGHDVPPPNEFEKRETSERSVRQGVWI